jgi:hypothetical protein
MNSDALMLRPSPIDTARVLSGANDDTTQRAHGRLRSGARHKEAAIDVLERRMLRQMLRLSGLARHPP